jgi:hypothetical protein
MSPEQLRGGKITAVSDIYSLAVIAYELVTGRRPFNPTSPPQLLELHRAGVRVRPVDLRSDLSTKAQAIILRALSFAPEDRYQSASEFGDALARALSESARATPVEAKRDEYSPAKPANALGINALGATVQMAPDAAAAAADNPGAASVNPIAANSGRSRVVSTRVKAGIAAFLLVVAAALIGVYLFRGRQQSARSASKPQQTFSYWLTIQKMRDGRIYQDPFQSSGQEVFENGYKFRLNVSSPAPGYLYVFNEGPPEADGATFTMLYPTPLRSNAFVSNQAVHTNWNTFRGQAGTENLWIVWSASAVNELESAKAEAFNSQKGALTANSIRAVREFLKTHAEAKAESIKDTVAQQTRVSGVGDIVVKLAQLEHR